MKNIYPIILIVVLFSISGCSSLGKILLSDYKKDRDNNYEILLGHKLKKGGRVIDDGERLKLSLDFQKNISEVTQKIPSEQIVRFDLLNLAITEHQQKNCLVTPLSNFLGKKPVSYSNYKFILDDLKQKLNHIKESNININDILLMNIDQRIQILSLFPEKVNDLVIASEIIKVRDLAKPVDYSTVGFYDHLYARLRVLNEIANIVEYLPVLKPMMRGVIVSDYGDRINPRSGKIVKHHGVDIRGKYLAPVYATAKGTVQKVKYNKGYGFYVVVDHKYGLSTIYAHLSYPMKVSVGQVVQPMQLIGFQGDSGNSTSDHLHYEIRHKNLPINPHIFLSIANKCDL